MAQGRKTGGRKKGTPNKINGDVKMMILTALAGVGGVKYLQQQASESPAAFLTLVGKVLPLPGDPEKPLTINMIERRIVRTDADH